MIAFYKMYNSFIKTLLKTRSYKLSTLIPEKLIDLEQVSFDPSPNKSKRKRDIDCIVLHHTGPGTFNGIVSWLKSPQAQASAHYVIGTKKDEIKQLVKLKEKAWHVGRSETIINEKTVGNLNHNSIGIEICNIGLMQKHENGKIYYEVGRNLKRYKGETKFGRISYPDGSEVEGYYAPYTKEQITCIIALCKALIKKYPKIKKGNVFTHFWVGKPIGRKNDPFGLDVDNIIKEVFKTSV